MNAALDHLRETGIIPSVRLSSAEEAIRLGKALIEGDIWAVEIQHTEGIASESVRILSSELPELLVGVAGVRTAHDAKHLITAGARFLSSWGTSPAVADACREEGVLFIPSISSPREVEEALSSGLATVKLCPAEQLGGPAAIKEFSRLFPEACFMPSGGVTRDTMNHYLKSRNVPAVYGTWMTEGLLSSGRFEEVTRLSHEAVLALHNFGLLHIGINHNAPEKAVASAEKMSTLFGFPLRERPNSMFAGLGFEMMKTPDLGENGHIALGVNDIPRALAHLRRKGVLPLPGTERWNDDGTMRRVYIDLEVSGFAFHLRTYP